MENLMYEQRLNTAQTLRFVELCYVGNPNSDRSGCRYFRRRQHQDSADHGILPTANVNPKSKYLTCNAGSRC